MIHVGQRYEELAEDFRDISANIEASLEFFEKTGNADRAELSRSKLQILRKLARVLETSPESLEIYLDVALGD